MSTLTIKDVSTFFNVRNTTVYSWIKKGWLKSTTVESSHGRYHKIFLIEEKDLNEFMRSDYYEGRPEYIRSNIPFNRTPLLEDCYPINLLTIVNGIRIDSEEAPPVDIWEYDIRQFKHLITLLTDREQRILEMRYQLGMTLDEVGAAYNVTRERIRMIQAKAQRKLKHYILKNGCKIITAEEYRKLQGRCTALEKELTSCKAKLMFQEQETSASDDDFGQFYNTTIEELDFSVRSYNCLKRAGIHTLKDIFDFDENQQNTSPDHPQNRTWMTIRNLGKKSLMEIAKKVHAYCRYRIRYYDVPNKKFAGEIPICPGEGLVIGNVYFYCGEESKND